MKGLSHFVLILGLILLYPITLWSQRLLEGRLDYATMPFPAEIAVKDFDGDAYPDLAVVSAQTGRLQIFKNLGKGIFRKISESSLPGKSQTIASADLDQDGWNDLVVGVTEKNHILILYNRGNGQFRKGEKLSTGNWPAAILIEDMDGNGHLDIVVANALNDEVTIFYNRGDRLFSAMNNYISGWKPAAVAAVRWPGHEVPDLLVANEGRGNLALLQNLKQGTFAPAQIYPAGKNPVSLCVQDINQDGLPDAVAANFGNNTVSLYWGQQDGSFLMDTTLAVELKPTHVRLQDLDGDRFPELLVTSAVNNSLMVFKNHRGSFDPQPAEYGLGIYPKSFVLTDVDLDGQPDIISANSQGKSFSVLLNLGQGRFMQSHYFVTGERPTQAAAADFDHDGLTDVAIIDQKNGRVLIHKNLGEAQFAPGQTYFVGTTPRQLSILDFNQDGFADVAVISEHSYTVGFYRNQTNGQFSPSLQAEAAVEPIAMLAGHFWQAQKWSLAITSKMDQQLYLFGQLQDSLFVRQDTLDTQTLPVQIAAIEWNHDGRVDLAVLNQYSRSLSLYQNTGSSFSPVGEIRLPFEASSMAVQDFDQDGWQDFALLDAAKRKVHIYRALQNGNFADAMQIHTGPHTTALQASDLNADGFSDILITDRFTSDLKVFLNLSGETMVSENFYGVGKNPSHILTADFNNDRRPDVVVCNADDGTFTLLQNIRHPVWEMAGSLNLPDFPIAMVPVQENTFMVAYQDSLFLSMVKVNEDQIQEIRRLPVTSPVVELRALDRKEQDGPHVAMILRDSADLFILQFQHDGQASKQTIVEAPAPVILLESNGQWLAYATTAENGLHLTDGLNTHFVPSHGKIDQIIPMADGFLARVNGDTANYIQITHPGEEWVEKPAHSKGLPASVNIVSISPESQQLLLFGKNPAAFCLADFASGRQFPISLPHPEQQHFITDACQVDINGDNMPDLLWLDAMNNQLLSFIQIDEGKYGLADITHVASFPIQMATVRDESLVRGGLIVLSWEGKQIRFLKNRFSTKWTANMKQTRPGE